MGEDEQPLIELSRPISVPAISTRISVCVYRIPLAYHIRLLDGVFGYLQRGGW